jgi:predicted nucleic acid-binding protein
MTPKAGDTLFVDTNILLTATDEKRSNHDMAQAMIGEAVAKGIHLAVSGQILREYLVVATRPMESNGLGLSGKDALANVEEFLRRMVVYDETEDVARRLRSLVRTCDLSGRRIHDANVAATMLMNGLSLVLTENDDDFRGLPGVVTVSLPEAWSVLHKGD